jgi:hypothetical protein
MFLKLFLIGLDLKYWISTSKITSAMCNKNGKFYEMKNIWHRANKIWTHCFSVAIYYVASYYRFFNTDQGK